jgi:hypothetical protein
MKSTVCWNAMLYRLGGTYRHVEGKCCLHFQGLIVSQASNQWGASFLLLPWLTFRPSRWRQCVPPKLQETYTRVRRITFENAGLFTVTTMRTSNPTVGLSLLSHLIGRAIAQAVSRRLPNAAARVRAPVRLCGICGGQSGTVAGFLRGLQFTLPILIPPTTSHSSSSIIRGWYNRPISGRRTKWTQSHPTPWN